MTIHIIAGKVIFRGQARFSKADRLLHRDEFQRVKRLGVNRYTAHFIVSLAENDEHRPRLGVVTTKRLGKAVRRNRVKRLLREFFRLHKGVLPPQDIVIIAKRGAADLTYAQVKAELEVVLSFVGAQDGACG
ncbi:MAG: ribonuclease P protein component [Deltaproteobacteria bacterium]|nr:ribonuclease P protein component [Deltaproteobacteria bacterium]